jgi:hypothetical protein
MVLGEPRDKDISDVVDGITFVTHESNSLLLQNVKITYKPNPSGEDFGDNFNITVS